MTDRELQSRIRLALDGGLPPLPDDPALAEAVIRRHEKKRRQTRARARGMRAAVALAVIALVVCGGAILQGWSRTYLDVRQSEDGEQYIMQGVSVTPPVGQTADAASAGNGMIVLHTKNPQLVVEALGEAPLLPTWLPDGWEVDDYSIAIDYTMKRLVVAYNKFRSDGDEADRLIYRTTIFNDLEDFRMTIEANNEGHDVMLENGLSVYMDMNVDRPTSMWRDGLTGYSLSGDITPEELLRIIRAMYDLN